MLQFINKIGVKNGFVDLHNHTDRSFGEERNRMNLSPVDLLNSALAYSTNNNGASVTFAITDHNNIESVFEVQEQIAKNPELYKNIHFIKGCEFSCGGSCFGKTIDENGNKHRIIKGFHMLAYNFDENNEKLNFVTKLYDDSLERAFVRDNTKVSSGRYILSLRNLMFEDGLYVPLEEFYDCNLDTSKTTADKFVKNLLEMCKAKFCLTEEYCQTLYTKLFSTEFFKTFKIEAMELAEIVEEAGGCVVLAHPNLISFAKSYERLYASEINKKYKNLEQVKFVVSNLKNFVSPYTNKNIRGLVGMEVLHSANFNASNAFEKLLQIAKDNQMYITCGSDSHGTLLQSYFSEIFPRRFSLDLGINIMSVNKNLFADMICNNTLQNNYNCTLDFEQQIKVVEGNINDDKFMSLQDVLERNIASLACKQKTNKTNDNVAKPKQKNKSKKSKRNKNNDYTKYKTFYKTKDKSKKYKKDFQECEDYVFDEKIRRKSPYESMQQEY